MPELFLTPQFDCSLLTTVQLKRDFLGVSPQCIFVIPFSLSVSFSFIQDLAGRAGSGASLPEKLLPLVSLEAGHVEPAPAEDTVAFNPKAAWQHRPLSRLDVHFIEAQSRAHELFLCLQSPLMGRHSRGRDGQAGGAGASPVSCCVQDVRSVFCRGKLCRGDVDK